MVALCALPWSGSGAPRVALALLKRFQLLGAARSSPDFLLLFLLLLLSLAVIRFFDSVKVDRTQSWLYAACSLSYLGAMVSSNSALQFVNYPTQVMQGRLRGTRRRC